MHRDYIALQAAIDQERAECDEWWREATDGAKIAVIHLIQLNYESPAMEVMSRFAQLAFSEAAMRNAGAK